MIKTAIIYDLCDFYSIDRHKLIDKVKTCKEKGTVSSSDVEFFINHGVPIVQTMSGILKTSSNGVWEIIRSGRVTHDDLLIIIGIIAQDCKIRNN